MPCILFARPVARRVLTAFALCRRLRKRVGIVLTDGEYKDKTRAKNLPRLLGSAKSLRAIVGGHRSDAHELL